MSLFPSVDPNFGSRDWLLSRWQRPENGPIHALAHPRFGFLVDVARAKLLGRKAKWVRLNDESDARIYHALLASAALPVILPPRSLDREVYRDGGLADNAPAGALVGQLEHRRMVVVHLDHLPLFSTADLRAYEVLQIVPSAALWPSGPLGKLTSLVDLSPVRVRELAELGYDDAASQLGEVWSNERAEVVGDFLAHRRRTAVDELDEPT